MKLKNAIVKLENDLNVKIYFRDHFQNVVIRYDIKDEYDYTESYFSIRENDYDGYDTEKSTGALLDTKIETLEFEFSGAYNYLWPYYKELKAAILEHIIERN